MRSFFAALALVGAVFAPGNVEAATTVLVDHSDGWHYRKGTNAPQANWKDVADAGLDGTWLGPAPGGFGYGDGDDTTQLNDMQNRYRTVYIRRTFVVTESYAAGQVLQLVMDWDDGFVAYVDGVERARSLAPGVEGQEPAFDALATGLHEAENGNSSPQPAMTFVLGDAATLLPLGEHRLAIIGLNESAGSSDLSLIADLEVGDPPPLPIVINSDTTWTVANSPYDVPVSVTVASGVTLTIEPGVTVRFGQSAPMVVDGRLLAEGTPEQRIVFTVGPGASAWDKIQFGPNPQESRIVNADVRFATGSGNIEAVNTRLYLEGVVWSDTDSQLLDVIDTSIRVKNCVFPSIGSAELLHFSDMPATGYARVEGCVFGPPTGYNDVIDFTGGNRPGPIVEFIDNVFLMAVDDCYDMDGTDAHIEGNIFMNVKQDGVRSSSSNAISTGADGSNTSELVIVRNLFYNCDHAILLKDRGSALVQNNTVVGITPNAVAAQPPAFINFGEPNRDVPGGRGALLDGNLVWDLEGAAFLNFTSAVMFLTVDRSILENTVVPGTGNSTNDPLFVNWMGPMTAANIRSNLALLPGSPAIGTGPNGLDMGALVPAGASISGEPQGTTTNTSAMLTVGGPGIYAYRWKLNQGPWSAEVPLTTSLLITPTMFTNAQPIQLANLTNGTYTVFVIGKNSAGTWQSTNSPAVSKTWTVDTDGFLEIASIHRTGNTIELRFMALAGKSYTVQYSDSLTDPDWRELEDVPAQGQDREVLVLDSIVGHPSRFYRVVTPAT